MGLGSVGLSHLIRISLTPMHCRQGRVHPMAVIGLPCATHDIAPGVTKVSPVLGVVFMKLDEGWEDGLGKGCAQG